MQSDWKDRKGRFPIYLFDRMCPDTFLIVSRIELWFLFLFLCSFWGHLIRVSRAGESQLKTASSRPVLLAGSRRSVCIQLLAVLKHTSLLRLFPRAMSSFGARGALISFILAVVALELVESRQSEHSSSSGVAKRSSKTRTAAIG